MDDSIDDVRAMLARARPTAGSFEERRKRWTKTFHEHCPVPSGTAVTPWHDGTVGGEWVCAEGVNPTHDKILLHLHGGGYARHVGPLGITRRQNECRDGVKDRQ